MEGTFLLFLGVLASMMASTNKKKDTPIVVGQLGFGLGFMAREGISGLKSSKNKHHGAFSPIPTQ